MKCDKIKELATTIVEYSLKIKEKDRVEVMFSYEARDLVEEIVKKLVEKKAYPILKMNDPKLSALVNENITTNIIEENRIRQEFLVDRTDAYISIRYNYNDYETKNVSKDKLKELGLALEVAHDKRINEREWVLLNYPSNIDAYNSKMTTRDFEEFAWDVMTVDYKKMSEDIKPLKDLMEKTDKVRIVGPNTDISFSIKGMPAVPCVGERNIPDGELYSAPIKTSVNGMITYNTPSPYQGEVFNHVSLTFRDGKIINATCDEGDEALNKIFDSDEGARYVGEFSLGFNPKILYPMGDILYDEKILGSLHFTPGRCYKDCDNGNKSTIHWDMVLVQREDFGGGEIYFDDVLIRKDGKFLLPELEKLNYNYFK